MQNEERSFSTKGSKARWQDDFPTREETEDFSGKTRAFIIGYRALKRNLLLLVFVLVGVASASDNKPSLSPDSIGVVYLTGESDKAVDLRIVFPALQVLNYPENFPGSGDYKATTLVSAAGQLILFDNKGPLATLKTIPEFRLTFWCENDGGMQFRPEAKMTIPRSLLKRSLKPNVDIQGIAGFASLNSPQRKASNKSVTTTSEVRMKGDLDGNNFTDALIWVSQDEAGNCDGKPENNLTVDLKTEKFDRPLRCCGP